MVLISLLAILAALVFISIMAFKGHPPLACCVVGVAIICLLTWHNFDTGLVTEFSAGVGNMVTSIAIFFIICNIFGGLMTASGYADVMADFLSRHVSSKFAPTSIILATTLLGGFGGLHIGSLPLMYPIAMKIYAKAGYSKGLIGGCCFAGFWTITNMLPYVAAGPNIFCSAYLGTDSTAGAKMGLVTAVVMVVVNCVAMEVICRIWKKKGKGFDSWDDLEAIKDDVIATKSVHPVITFLPPIITLVCYNFFHMSGALATLCSCIFIVVQQLLSRGMSFKQVWETIEKSGYNGVIPTFNLALMAGMGAVIKTTPFFGAVVEWCTTTTMNPYIICFGLSALMAGIMGSGISGLATFVPALGDVWQRWAGQGYSLGLMHRLMGCGEITLDSLPHNGSLIACFTLLHTNHKESYFGVFVTCTVVPLLVGILVSVPLAMIGFE